MTILTACLSCGTPARSAASTFCGRCGRPFGAPPPAHVELPACPVCYRSADDDGRFPSASLPGLRLDLPRHVAEHDRHPVGDDDHLELLREGSRIRIGRVLRSGGVALVYDLRPFAYLRHELEVFLAGTPFEGSHLERDLVRLGPLPAAFVRIRLVRPAR